MSAAAGSVGRFAYTGNDFSLDMRLYAQGATGVSAYVPQTSAAYKISCSVQLKDFIMYADGDDLGDVEDPQLSAVVLGIGSDGGLSVNISQITDASLPWTGDSWIKTTLSDGVDGQTMRTPY